MSVNSIPFNPFATGNFQGSFSITSDGFVQGVAMDDPAIRSTLAGGVISPAETLPMIGGALIYETVAGGFNVLNGADSLGGLVGRATSLASATGFSVLNQAHHWLSSPQSEAPVGLTGSSVHFHRFGSGARIAVAMDVQLATSLQTQLTTTQVSWDLIGQRLVPYKPAYAAQNITNATWANGVVTLTFGGAHGFVAGDDISVVGVLPAAYNGSYTVASAPTGTTLTYNLPLAAALGAGTAFGSVAAGGGALPVRILDINVGNSKVITVDAFGGYHWSSNGTAALILI